MLDAVVESLPATRILLLALLIAYSAASINTDERRREHATLFAFGLRVRRVLRMEVVEALLVGTLGTAIGVAPVFWINAVSLAGISYVSRK